MQSHNPAILGCSFSRLLNGRSACKQEKCWQTTSTLNCCSCCNLQCCGFLLLPLIIMWSHPAPKWILREFDVSRIRPRLAWVSSPWNVDMAKFDLSWEGYLVWQTGLPTLKGDPTYHVNVIKLKWDYMDRWVTPHTWGPPPQCQQALTNLRQAMQRIYQAILI